MGRKLAFSISEKMLRLAALDEDLVGQHLYTKIAKIVNKIKHANPRET